MVGWIVVSPFSVQWGCHIQFRHELDSNGVIELKFTEIPLLSLTVGFLQVRGFDAKVDR